MAIFRLFLEFNLFLVNLKLIKTTGSRQPVVLFLDWGYYGKN